jgi:hypothetical protein
MLEMLYLKFALPSSYFPVIVKFSSMSFRKWLSNPLGMQQIC